MIQTIARTVKVLVFSAAFVFPPVAMGHGESEPGPNGGEIRMPGAFHIEAVSGDDALRVYLLDMQFKNPQVADSSVAASLNQNGETRELKCSADDGSKRFVCPLPEEADLTEGELMVDASRDGVPGQTARYELPLMQGDNAGAGEQAGSS